MPVCAAKGSRKNKFTFWRERRAGRCKAPRRRRCGDIVEERHRRRCLPAAAPRRLPGRRLGRLKSESHVLFAIGHVSRKQFIGLGANSKM